VAKRRGKHLEKGDILRALPYLKPDLSGSDEKPALVLPSADDAPIFEPCIDGVLLAYLIDHGDRYLHVQGRDLREQGVSIEELRSASLENLSELSDGEIKLAGDGPMYTLFFDGNLEASLILLDDLWDEALRPYYESVPVVAIPTRDVLVFSDARSAEGIAELRAVIERGWDGGDPLISRSLYVRRAGRWEPFDP
jgi:uncharacterized protein YtpQ (UPF0354 family)